jgi:hypothetical protein
MRSQPLADGSDVTERPVDFGRDRHMLCGNCRQRFVVGLDWLDRWGERKEECPSCGLTCEHEDAPRVTVDPDDPALDDSRVALFSWYHSSTQPDWPTRNFDPAAVLTPHTRRVMGGDGAVVSWAARQRAKALHVGTYEAAVQNMLRRICDQADRGAQFYLYRVHLKPSVVVRDGWLIDPSNFVGDVALAEVCPNGVDVARYLNYHEDPGGLSVALGRDAIASVQRVAVPVANAWDDQWVCDAAATLEAASVTLVPATGKFSRFMLPSSPRAAEGRKLGAALAARLPTNLQRQYESAAAFEEGDEPLVWARRASALAGLIEDPGLVLKELDGQSHRQV